MPKYEVVRPWHGVKKGDVVEIKNLHPALKSNVRPLKGVIAELVPATPKAAVPKKDDGERKGVIAKRLKELNVQFDGRKNAEELAALLPEGELKKLFP